MNALNKFTPNWRSSILHESSPGGPLSRFLESSCAGYSSSHFYPNVPRGSYDDRHRSEDLSALTFPDSTFDIIVTSDVLEHVFQPSAAFKEIARVLKPGGVHCFTTPWYPANKQSIQRARIEPDGQITHLSEPVYHGNPIDAGGSLVTFDWGLDFTDFILSHGGMTTIIYLCIDRSKGLDGEFLEVFISRKLDTGS